MFEEKWLTRQAGKIREDAENWPEWKKKAATNDQHIRQRRRQMAEKDSKWLMFKNYMHNELGLTREDIQEWLKDAVKETAERMVAEEMGRFSLKEYIAQAVEDHPDWFSNSKAQLNHQIQRQVVEEICDRLDIKVKQTSADIK